MFLSFNTLTDFDDCDGNPCQNGGSCLDGIGTFSCTCAEDYTDETCSTSRLIDLLFSLEVMDGNLLLFQNE